MWNMAKRYISDLGLSLYLYWRQWYTKKISLCYPQNTILFQNIFHQPWFINDLHHLRVKMHQFSCPKWLVIHPIMNNFNENLKILYPSGQLAKMATHKTSHLELNIKLVPGSMKMSFPAIETYSKSSLISGARFLFVNIFAHSGGDTKIIKCGYLGVNFAFLKIWKKI